VLISAEDYESIESLKLQLLQLRAAQAKEQIKAGEFTDGESFFEDLNAGRFD
jgi:PHD/YefM family antitoxin component YafN of YafNO toxin-antitoxin module